MAYKSLPLEQQPPIKPKEYGDPDAVLKLLRAMVLMMTTLLQPAVKGEAHSRILGVRVRLFLSVLEEFEIPMRRKKQSNTSKKKAGKKAVVETEPAEEETEPLVEIQEAEDDEEKNKTGYLNNHKRSP